MKRISSAGLIVNMFISDRHISIAAHIRKNMAEILHAFDIWHVSKSLRKKMRALAKKLKVDDITQWTKSIINHLYWAILSTPDNDKELMLSKWLSVINHIANIHYHPQDNFPRCLHEPGLERNYLDAGKLSILQQNQTKG